MSLPDARLLAAELFRDAADKGVFIEINGDFTGFTDISDRIAERDAVTPMFDPRFSVELGEHNAFWVKGVDREGTVVHLQAFRLDRIDDSLADAMANWLVPLYRSSGHDPRAAASGLSPSPIARGIAGKVAYHGELWIKARSGKGMIGLSDLLPRLGLVMAYLKWRPDWVYGLVAGRKACSGLATRWGYTMTQPGVLCWERPPRDEPPTEWIVAASQADIEHMIGMQAREVILVKQVTELAAEGTSSLVYPTHSGSGAAQV